VDNGVCILPGWEWDCGNSTGRLLPPQECVFNFDGVGLAIPMKCILTAYDVFDNWEVVELTLISRCNMFE